MDEPNANYNEYLTVQPSGEPSDGTIPDNEILLTALELKASLADFRKAVLNALEQKRATHHIREPVWLNSREAEQMMKICSKTLCRYRKQNLIGYRVIHKNYLYRYSEIMRFLEQRNKLK